MGAEVSIRTRHYRTSFDSYNERVPASVRREIGQLLIGSLPGVTIPSELRSLAREFQLGGVILFARNIEAPEQVAELSHDVQSLSTESPLWVSVDQEGGRVAVMRYRKRYRIENGKRSRQGQVIQELRWQLVGQQWLIFSERDIKVL